MTATPRGLAIAFNQWPTDDRQSSQDGPGQRVVFTTVPYSAFKTDDDDDDDDAAAHSNAHAPPPPPWREPAQHLIFPDRHWNDTAGERIEAHAAGMLRSPADKR
jgi:hypothetical protein